MNDNKRLYGDAMLSLRAVEFHLNSLKNMVHAIEDDFVRALIREAQENSVEQEAEFESENEDENEADNQEEEEPVKDKPEKKTRKAAGEKTVTKKPAEEKVKTAHTSEKSVPEESDDYTAERLLMKEEVRGVLSRVAKAGYRQEVRDLLTKRNAKHLDDVDPKDYAALVAEAEELANG